MPGCHSFEIVWAINIGDNGIEVMCTFFHKSKLETTALIYDFINHIYTTCLGKVGVALMHLGGFADVIYTNSIYPMFNVSIDSSTWFIIVYTLKYFIFSQGRKGVGFEINEWIVMSFEFQYQWFMNLSSHYFIWKSIRDVQWWCCGRIQKRPSSHA